MEGLGLDLFGLAVEFQHVVEPSVEVWLGRQGGVDERTEVGQGLVVDRGDQESVSGRERREDLALDLPSEGHAVLTRDAPGEVDEDDRSEEHTSELQSQSNLVCRLLLEKKKKHAPRVSSAPHRPRARSWVYRPKPRRIGMPA